MGFAKTGTGEGKIIDVKDNVAKLGSKIECTGCGAKFAARKPDDFVHRRCPKCKER